jgi:GT2 family glycosyltransferase
MSTPVVSILVVNWNTRQLVTGCLDMLSARAPDDPPVEVIVVDNGSVDGSADALAARSDIDLIRNPRNLGFAAAVNQAYRRSRGEYVLLLNSDVELPPGALGVMTRFLEEKVSAAAVAPLYVSPDGSPQPFHFRLPTFAMTLANGSHLIRCLLPGSDRLLRDYRMLDDDFSEPRPVPQPSASCLLLRRSALDSDSIFDEHYPIFFNDVQLARSLGERGLQLWVTPAVTVVHEAHASTRMLGPTGKRQYIGSVVRMLSETESPAKVWVYRSVVFLQALPLWLFNRSKALGFTDLRKALSGDVGSLPTRPRPRLRPSP